MMRVERVDIEVGRWVLEVVEDVWMGYFVE